MVEGKTLADAKPEATRVEQRADGQLRSGVAPAVRLHVPADGGHDRHDVLLVA
jgi:hypothetical protein